MKKQRREVLVTVLGLALAAAGLVLARLDFAGGGALEALPYVMLGVGCGAVGNGLGGILARKAAEGDPELARQMEVDARDERNRAIADRAKGKAYDAMVYAFGAVLLAFALMKVGLMPVLLLASAYLFVIGSGVYYRVKFDREM